MRITWKLAALFRHHHSNVTQMRTIFGKLLSRPEVFLALCMCNSIFIKWIVCLLHALKFSFAFPTIASIWCWTISKVFSIDWARERKGEKHIGRCNWMHHSKLLMIRHYFLIAWHLSNGDVFDECIFAMKIHWVDCVPKKKKFRLMNIISIWWTR